MPVELPPLQANMSDEELKFRGWTRDSMRERWAAKLERDRNSPRAGDEAPDFELQDPEGNVRVRLSDFRGKRPVALVFGSYT